MYVYILINYHKFDYQVNFIIEGKFFSFEFILSNWN